GRTRGSGPPRGAAQDRRYKHPGGAADRRGRPGGPTCCAAHRWRRLIVSAGLCPNRAPYKFRLRFRKNAFRSTGHWGVQGPRPNNKPRGENMPEQTIVPVSHMLDEQGLSSLHYSLIFWCVLLSLIDGYDIAAIAFAAPHLMRDWHLTDRSALGPVLSASLV